MVLHKVSIDVSSICQLQCPECSNGKGQIKDSIVGHGFMTFEKFKSIIEANKWITEVELSNWGEVFLNPEITKILKYANDLSICLTIGNGANFNTITEDVLEALVKYKVEYINISIDGASQETYGKYRINGNYEVVLNNIVKLNQYKTKYNSIYPKVSWQFIIFGHNEHEIPEVINLCNKLQMVFNPKLNYSEFSPIKDKEFVKKSTGLTAVTREEYRKLFNKYYKRPCCQLWVSPQINWDGKLLGCCVNKWKAFDNVMSNGLMTSLLSSLYVNTKSTLMGEANLYSDMPCYYCPTFSQILDHPITIGELNTYSEFVHPAMKGNENIRND